MKANSLLHRVCLFALSCVAAVTLWHFPSGVNAQKAEKSKTSHPASAGDKNAAASKTATSKTEALNNAEYGAKVKEYTTQPYFMTEYVDHLPASDKVPSPDKVLGYAVGAPGHLTYTKDLYRYYRELEKTTARVRTFVAPEKSEEGKEQLLVAVGDEASIAKLDRYKAITAKLADPRKISDSEQNNLSVKGRLCTGLPDQFIRPRPARRRC